MLTCRLRASSTPRKSCNYEQLFCCGWVLLARWHEVAINVTSSTKAYSSGNVSQAATEVEMQNLSSATWVKVRAQLD